MSAFLYSIRRIAVCAAIACSCLSGAVSAYSQIPYKFKTLAAGGGLSSAFVLFEETRYGCGSRVLNTAEIWGACPLYSTVSGLTCWGAPTAYSGEGWVNSGEQNVSVHGYYKDNLNNKSGCNGHAEVGHTTYLYAPVILNKELRIRFRHSNSISWMNREQGDTLNSKWSVLYPNGGVKDSVNITPDSALSGANSAIGISTYAGFTGDSTRYIDDAGKRYYAIAGLACNAGAANNSGSQLANYAYACDIDNIEVQYTGKVIKMVGVDDQTGSTGKALPNGFTIQVIDGLSNAPVANEPIVFTMLNPVTGESLSATSTISDADGYATSYLTFGVSSGTYKVAAICPACVVGANISTFTATALGPRLACVNCSGSGLRGKELSNPFKFQVIDAVTGKGVPGAQIDYDVVNYISHSGETSDDTHGAGIRILNNQLTDIYGFARVYLTLGAEDGVYILRARCENCLTSPEQIARGLANDYRVLSEVPINQAADTSINEDDCTDGCCPKTPALRRYESNFSFTSYPGENAMELVADIKPDCLLKKGNYTVQWHVNDVPGDYIDSGTPEQPAAGAKTAFVVRDELLPAAPQGRALPLAYEAYYTYTEIGKEPKVSKSMVLRQNEIDKCRQEYIDFHAQLADAPRTAFVLGVSGDFEKYWDCFANIYPTKEVGLASGLINSGYGLGITSGYRSPRYNVVRVGSSLNSTHIFGEAADLLPSGGPSAWKQVWDATPCPKVLEYDKTSSILHCGKDTNNVVAQGSAFQYTVATSTDDINVFATTKNCIHIGELRHQ